MKYQLQTTSALKQFAEGQESRYMLIAQKAIDKAAQYDDEADIRG